MNFDLTTAASGVPALFSPDPSTARRTLEFFTADIRNANTRRAYAQAGADFAGWCADRGVRSRRNPATRSRHIPATWRAFAGHLEAG